MVQALIITVITVTLTHVKDVVVAIAIVVGHVLLGRWDLEVQLE